MIKVGIIGAGGYAGETLIGILLRHPEIKIIWLMSEPAHKGKKITDLYPHLKGETDLECLELDIGKYIDKVDLVFLALPHAMAMNYVPQLLKAKKKVIDFSADYRLSDKENFKKWYKVEHASPELLKEAVYGLPELHKEKVKKTNLLANPGCYPTAAILGIAPLVKEKLIDPQSIIIDAKTGVSGAGRGLSLQTHFPEINDGIVPYNIGIHRHTPEMDQEISLLAGKDIKVTFAPHLLSISRGILSTIYAQPERTLSKAELTKVYKNFYKNEPFIRIYEDKLPSTKYVSGTNFCDIAVLSDECTGRVVALAAIDNLVKGAAGQAVQNMNLMCGFSEDEGLKVVALYP